MNTGHPSALGPRTKQSLRASIPRKNFRSFVRSIIVSHNMEGGQEVPPTDTIHAFLRHIAAHHATASAAFIQLMETLIILEPHPACSFLLYDLVALRISPSFFHSSLFADTIQRALTQHVDQVNAADFVCAHFLRPLQETQRDDLDSQSLFLRGSKVPLVPGLACYSWDNETLYSLGPLFEKDNKAILIQAILSRYELTGRIDMVKAGDLEEANHFASLKSNGPVVFHPLEVMQEKFNVVHLAAGWNTIGAVNKNGGVALYGSRNVAGPVCLGTITSPKEWDRPVQADNVCGCKLKKIAAGPVHFCAVTEDGRLITWGMNVNLCHDHTSFSGQLGHKREIIHTPTLFNNEELEWGMVLDVACGIAHTVVLTTHGVYTFGSNNESQLGRVESPDATQLIRAIPPGAFEIGQKPHNIHFVTCGGNHCLAISMEGGAWAWGDNSRGQCQQNRITFPQVPGPMAMTPPRSPKRFMQAAGGFAHTLLLTDEGELYACGSNLFGQLGIGVEHDVVPILTKIRFPVKGTSVWRVSACGHASSGITTEGNLYQWGLLRSANRQGNQFTPLLASSISEQLMFITRVEEGIDHSVITANHSVTESLQYLAKACRAESSLVDHELYDALQAVPAFLLSSIQERVSRWLHEKYPLRPYVTLSLSSFAFEVLDTRNLTDTLIKRHRKSTQAVEYGTMLEHAVEVTNPLSRTMQIQVQVHCHEIPSDQQNFQLLAIPSELTLSKRTSGTISLRLRYSEKDPPPQQWLIVTISAVQKAKHSVEAPPPNTVCRQFVLLRLKTIHRVSKRVGGPRPHLAEINRPSTLDLLNSQLSPYLPHILLSKFKEDPTPPREPYIEKFAAAILFVDISGFTSLNERLAALGPAGPERVSHHINSYFTSLIKAVDDHGGDTLKFAGDALICMFGSPTCTDSLRALTRQAAQCALSIQTTLARYDSNQGFTLTLHVGIGAGEIYALYVGGVQHSWEFLVTGEPLVQLRTCVDLSSAGEVVVSSQVWELIAPFFEGKLLADSENQDWLVTRVVEEIETAPLPTLPSHTSEFSRAARCFIPQAVQVQIDSKQTKWMDELRVVTILFVKLNSPIPSTTMEEFCQSLHQYLVLMQTEIFRYEGMVRQFLADDKGTVLIAAFGLPPSSHMDGGLRGIRAAVAIHSNLKQVGMDNSIGITTGAVFCGAVGATNRREYAMVGDTVNLSARLMVAASKRDDGMPILCDKVTAEGCKGKIDLQELEPILVKGKQHPVDIYRPRTALHARESHLVARHTDSMVERNLFRSCVGFDEEVSLIQKQLTAVRSRDLPCLLVMLQGDTGTGKTTLATLIQKKATQMAYLSVAGTGDSIATTTPYYLWSPILLQLLAPTHTEEGLLAAAPRYQKESKEYLEAIYARACVLAGPQYDDEMYLLRQAIPSLELPEEQVTQAEKSRLNGNQKKLRLSQLVTQMLKSLTKNGTTTLFLLLEDLQWADPASLHLLHHVVRNMEGAFFLCSRRPVSVQAMVPELEKMLSMQSCTTLDLKPFQEEQIIQLTRSLLSVSTVPRQLLQLLQPAQGNPMYCTEIIHHLLATKAIEIGPDSSILILADVDNIRLPDTLHEIIAGRFDNLPQTTQMLLKVASVIGVEFPIELLAEIYNNCMEVATGQSYIRRELQNAMTAEFVRQDTGNPRIYMFNNSFFQQVAYSRLLFSQRTRVHLTVAEHYQVLVESNTESTEVRVLYPVLHHHYSCILEASIADKNVDQLALRHVVRYLKLMGDYASQISQENDTELYKQALEKVELFADPTEKQKATMELKLKIIGAQQKGGQGAISAFIQTQRPNRANSSPVDRGTPTKPEPSASVSEENLSSIASSIPTPNAKAMKLLGMTKLPASVDSPSAPAPEPAPPPGVHSAKAMKLLGVSSEEVSASASSESKS